MDLGFSQLRIERAFKRIPSFAAVSLGRVGRVRKGEYSGLVERALSRPLGRGRGITLGSLGPFKIGMPKKPRRITRNKPISRKKKRR